MKPGRSHCSVVAGLGCQAWANAPGVARRSLATCYRCGEPVCRDPGCSLLMPSFSATNVRRRRRTCSNCLPLYHGADSIRWARDEAELDA